MKINITLSYPFANLVCKDGHKCIAAANPNQTMGRVKPNPSPFLVKLGWKKLYLRQNLESQSWSFLFSDSGAVSIFNCYISVVKVLRDVYFLTGKKYQLVLYILAFTLTFGYLFLLFQRPTAVSVRK
jgi:hypothetical protein